VHDDEMMYPRISFHTNINININILSHNQGAVEKQNIATDEVVWICI